MKRSLGVAFFLGMHFGPCGHTDSAATLDSNVSRATGAKEPRSTGELSDAAAVGDARSDDLNVLLISVDSLRADMPWAGYPRPIAPRLTELANKSVVYTKAYSISSYTSMSLGGFLGGKLPSELRRDGFFFSVYDRANVFFPQLLQAAGVHTVGGHAHGYFKDAGFEQGFDRWEVIPNLKWNNTTDENITSPELEAIAETLLSDADAGQARFFAWVHFLDPHDRYMAHAGIGPYGSSGRDRYDAEVTFTDRYIGKLLDFVATKPWGNKTAIIVTADHGEAFGEHHQYFHGFELWENLVHVPLLFFVPGAPPHAVTTPRGAVDIAPTILDLMKVPARADIGFEGTSLVPEIFGGEARERDVAIDLPETSDNDRRRALVHDNLKIISFGKNAYVQVFDLASDPDELKPISHGIRADSDSADPRGQAFDEMVTRYRAFEKTLKEIPPTKCREGCLNGAYAKKDGG